MKVAVTFENGFVFPHFGKTEQFMIYTIEDNKVVESDLVETKGAGHSALGQFLADKGVKALICGGIGIGAINFLSEYDITVYAGNDGMVEKVIDQFIQGKLDLNKEANCHHHDHDCDGGHCCH